MSEDFTTIWMGRSVVWHNGWWWYGDDPWDDEVHDGRLVQPDPFGPKKAKPPHREIVRKAREKIRGDQKW